MRCVAPTRSSRGGSQMRTPRRGTIRFWCDKWRVLLPGLPSDGRRRCGWTVCVARGSPPTAATVRPPRCECGGAGFLAGELLDSSGGWLERARTLAAAIGDARVEANAVGTLAGVAEDGGDWARAKKLYGQALVLRERIGDTRGVAADHNGLGLLAQRLGDMHAARREFETALAINRRDGRENAAATNLVNLAGLASLAGEFGTADAQYRDALAIWQAHEEWADAAAAWHGLGQVDLRRGDYPAAQAALCQALAVYARTGPVAEELAVRRDLAGALAAAGDLQGARDELSRAQRRADSTRALPAARAGIALARADLAVEFNALPEAQRLYARAEALYRLAAQPGGEAGAQEGRGLLLLARDDPVRAQALFETALRTYAGAGEQRAAGLTRISLAQALLARGDTTGSRRELGHASADLERSGDPVAAAAATGEWAALDVLAGPSRSLALAERRSSFFADKWDVYAQLAFVERDRARPGAAFEASESMRAREMLELLERGRVTVPAGVSADLVAREQDLRRRIAELTSEEESAEGSGDQRREPDLESSARASRETLARAQESYAELLLEMREGAPRHVALVAPEPRGWRDVANRLAPDAAFIEYLMRDSAAVAFVVTRDTLTIVDLGTTRRDLARLVEFARGTIELPHPLTPPLRGAERGPGGEDLW